MTFNPNDHLIRVQGNKEYLEVKWRLVWLREAKPLASVTTEVVTTTDKGVLFRAEVSWPEILDNGEVHIVRGVGTAYELWMDPSRKVGKPIENGETSAIGRALATLGFGTQHAPDFDEDLANKLSDSPVNRQPPQRTQSPQQSAQPPQQAAPRQPRQRPQPAAEPPSPASGGGDWIAQINAANSPADLGRIGNEMLKAGIRETGHPAKQRLRERSAELNGQVAEAVGAS